MKMTFHLALHTRLRLRGILVCDHCDMLKWSCLIDFSDSLALSAMRCSSYITLKGTTVCLQLVCRQTFIPCFITADTTYYITSLWPAGTPSSPGDSQHDQHHITVKHQRQRLSYEHRLTSFLIIVTVCVCVCE